MADFSSDEALVNLRNELTAARTWLAHEALPFWAANGFNQKSRMFEERLDFSGEPARGVPHRLMVQSRQIYVYSHATLLGWYDGRSLVEQALQSLLRFYGQRLTGVPYVFSIDSAGEVVDGKQDCYAYAFVLFALAWSRKLLGEGVKAELAEQLLEHLEAELAHDGGSGFLDGLPRPDRYMRQNPQMHLFEAAIEVEAAFGSSKAGALADSQFGLFRDRLFQRQLNALPELFDDGWNAIQGPDATFEPGHHFEWIWLLDRNFHRSGEPAEELISSLARRAYSEGIGRNGAVIEAVPLAEGSKKHSQRCWGTCEALKAAASDFERGRSPLLAIQRAQMLLRALRSVFLQRPIRAGWIDRVDEAGAPLVDYIPASSLYHIFLAVAEADRVFAKID